MTHPRDRAGTLARRSGSRVRQEPIFLDFQATTPLDPVVLEAMLPWMSGAWNAHAIEHGMGRTASAAVETAREQVAALLGCRSSEITFTSGATEASNIVLRGATSAGDAVVTTELEHASVSETADDLEANGRFIHRVTASEDGIVDVAALAEALDSQPALASITAVNSEIGTVQPIDDVAAMCADRDVPLHSDLTQAVGRIPVKLSDWFVSYASISSHKIYGPQGIGALFVADAAAAPRPLATGGGQENGLRPGTLPVASCIGFGAACDLARTRREQDDAHAQTLARMMLNGLSELEGWQLNGSLETRIPHNLSVAFEGVDAEMLLASLPELALATGSACSAGSLRGSATLRAISVPEPLANGTIRIGFGRTTTPEEVRTAASLLCDRVHLLRGDAP